MDTELSQLCGLHREARRYLESSGITTLAQVAALSINELVCFRYIGSKTAPGLRANAQAYVEGRAIWFGDLPEHCRCEGIMFDLETRYDNGKPWCFGWQGSIDMQIVVVAPYHHPEKVSLADDLTVTFVPHSDAAWRMLAAEAQTCPVYHWTNFDRGIMQQTAPPDARKILESQMHDLHHTYKTAVRLPLDSTSLKPVSAYLGFVWAGYTDPWNAYVDYRAWLERGDNRLLAQACRYQGDDVMALGLVWKWLTSTYP